MSDLNKTIGSYEPDNLFAANQELPAVAAVLTIAASQNLKRGSLVNVSGEQIAATTDGVKASGTITFADQPSADDSVTVGTTTLTSKNSRSGRK